MMYHKGFQDFEIGSKVSNIQDFIGIIPPPPPPPCPLQMSKGPRDSNHFSSQTNAAHQVKKLTQPQH